MNLFLVRLFGPGPSWKSTGWGVRDVGPVPPTGCQVTSQLLFAYLSRMQALTLLKHRVSEFFTPQGEANANNEERYWWQSITGTQTGQRQMVSPEPETAREVTRRSFSQHKAFSDVPLLSLTSSPQCLLETNEISICIVTKRLPQERASGRCYPLWAWYHLALIHYRPGWSELRVLSLAPEKGVTHISKRWVLEKELRWNFPSQGNFSCRPTGYYWRWSRWLEVQST